jgi:hypothetical protein
MLNIDNSICLSTGVITLVFFFTSTSFYRAIKRINIQFPTHTSVVVRHYEITIQGISCKKWNYSVIPLITPSILYISNMSIETQ